MARAWVRVEFNHIPRIAGVVRDRLAMAVQTTAMDVWGESVRLVVEHAFLTGNLAGSLSPRQISKLVWVIETHVAYAHWVHDGTHTMAARPWFIWASEAKAGAFRLAVSQALMGGV